MAYTTIDNPELYFQCKNYSGNNSTNAITFDGSEDMSPNMVWLKGRSGADNHRLYDTLRSTSSLVPNDNRAEQADGNFSSFNSDGFTITGTDTGWNGSGETYVSWNWKETATAGFDIVAYTGTGSSNAVSHSLSATPNMIIIKNRDDSDSWYAWHQGLGAVASNYINLDTSGAKSSVSDGITAISSSNFTVNTRGDVNASSEKYIAYCFADVKGYSKIGSYTGNGNADGTFVYTGFKPAWVMVKRTDAAADWFIRDNKQDPENVMNEYLSPNTTATSGNLDSFDFISNGFKIRNSNNAWNGSGNTYIYLAFAESPFVNSKGVPTNAR